MKLRFNLVPEKLDEFSKTFLILSNFKRLQLLLLLKKVNRASSADLHREAEKSGIYENRETTYRALEELAKTKFVCKEYDEEKKELVYYIKNEDTA